MAAPSDRAPSYCGRRVVVFGLGRFGGGTAAARWLAQQGAEVTVTDKADAQSLEESRAALADVPIAHWRLGEHHAADFADADVVVVNPAIKPGNEFLKVAQQSGARLTTEIELFLEGCPTPNLIGVTGSNGKSTTAAMTAAAIAAGGRTTWLGGNIGRSLLGEPIGAEDWVVLELSSFQLARLASEVRWPRIAVVTNCTPNHLDWHADFADYRGAKQRLLTQLPPDGIAIFDMHDAELAGWQSLCPHWQPPIADERVPELVVPGVHNRANAALAFAAALATGVAADDVTRGLAQYPGLPHRLERVVEIAGRTFYNDSLATTPESAMAALASFDAPVWLLAGGADKGSDFGAFAQAVAARACGAAFFGAMGESLAALTQAATDAWASPESIRRPPIVQVADLAEALAWCWTQSAPGDVILLSPACASFDQFRNFAERGETFRRLVNALGRDAG